MSNYKIHKSQQNNQSSNVNAPGILQPALINRFIVNFILNGQPLPTLSHTIIGILYSLSEKLIETDIEHDMTGNALLEIDQLVKSKNFDIILENIDFSINVTFRLSFHDVTIIKDTVLYDYALSGKVIHKLVIQYKNVDIVKI